MNWRFLKGTYGMLPSNKKPQKLKTATVSSYKPTAFSLTTQQQDRSQGPN